MASNDQLTFTDPVTRFPDITPPKQDQPEPGLDAELIPGTDRGEDSYRRTPAFSTAARALITGADSGIGAAVAIAFTRKGADVALNYLPQEEKDAQHIAEIIRRTGRRAILLPRGPHRRELLPLPRRGGGARAGRSRRSGEQCRPGRSRWKASKSSTTAIRDHDL